MSDPRIIIGLIFILGYYGTIWTIGFRLMPEANLSLVKDAMLQIGPAIGVIVGALFRQSTLDEKREDNTAAAFMALSPPSGEPQAVKVVNDHEDPVPTTTEETKL